MRRRLYLRIVFLTELAVYFTTHMLIDNCVVLQSQVLKSIFRLCLNDAANDNCNIYTHIGPRKK